MNTQSQIAVLTGDVVDSRNTPGEWLLNFKRHLESFGPSPKYWEIYRGDSFQVRLDDASEALHKAIWLKAAMRSDPKLGLDLRLGIGIGAVDFSAEKVTESNGEAFVHSGRSFDALRKNTIAISTPWPDVDQPVNLCLKLAEHIMGRWTWRQAQVVKTSMEMPDARQEDIARALNTIQENVSKRQAAAGYDAMIEMVEYCNALVRNHLQT